MAICSAALVLVVKLLFLAVALMLGACASDPALDAEATPSAVAEVVYTDRLATVSLPVACDEFGGVLGFASDTVVVRDSTTVARLQLAASEAVPVSAHEMDARLVAVVRDRRSTDTLCVGGFHSAEVNGVPVQDSALVRLLWTVVGS